MRLLHLSDLHLSRYGETVNWGPPDTEQETELLHTWHRWQIEGLREPKKNKRSKLRLVDPEGVIQRVRSWPKRDDKAVAGLLNLAMERHETSAEHLLASPPTDADLQSLLRLDPINTNLRFIEMLSQVLTLEPKLVCITGDLTDNGFGYELITRFLADWISAGRLLVVPGNHDSYDMRPGKERRARTAVKEERYRRFATQDVGLELTDEGAWFRLIDDVAFVGLNSCRPPRRPLSATGEVSAAQLRWLAELSGSTAFRSARLRVAMVHHHVLRMPFAVGRRNPIEVAMRLHNAGSVMETCRDARIDLLMNGHRHHGYSVQLPALPVVISSPSSTLGCRFAKQDYVWTIDLDRPHTYPELRSFSGLRSQVEAKNIPRRLR